MKLASKRIRTLEELWAIEDEFPAVCGPSPLSYATRHGLTLSKSYLAHLRQKRLNATVAKPARERDQPARPAKNSEAARSA